MQNCRNIIATLLQYYCPIAYFGNIIALFHILAYYVLISGSSDDLSESIIKSFGFEHFQENIISVKILAEDDDQQHSKPLDTESVTKVFENSTTELEILEDNSLIEKDEDFVEYFNTAAYSSDNNVTIPQTTKTQGKRSAVRFEKF